MRWYRLGWRLGATLAVAVPVVWWVLVWAFGNLLYTAALARFEAHYGIEDAKMIAALAEYILPLVAVGALAALAYAAGASRSRKGTSIQSDLPANAAL